MTQRGKSVFRRERRLWVACRSCGAVVWPFRRQHYSEPYCAECEALWQGFAQSLRYTVAKMQELRR